MGNIETDHNFATDEVEHAQRQVLAINQYLVDKSPTEIVEWVVNSFDPNRIFTLTSAGFSAPITLDLLDETAERGMSPKIPVIHNDTGMLTSEVYYYRDRVLERNFGFSSIVTGPDQAVVDEILRTESWKIDENEYRRQTKYGPIDDVIKALGAQVLITGVRQDQTQNRGELAVVTYGSNGELRVNPNFYTEGQAIAARLKDIIQRRQLERHPLDKLVAFIDDWPFLGGPKTECGINSAGRLITLPVHAMPELLTIDVPQAA